ncbi:MAG TPA: penicillin-binding transpeptidase domain-containing protein [Streptosporangiaceae bacterium]|nr:penicillin-binding transpeptidase domain-containing protein [Streptosporangiaceae bacterium]
MSSESGDGWSSGPWYASEPSTSEFPAYGSQEEEERPRKSGSYRSPGHRGGGRGGHGGGGRRRNLLVIVIAGGLAIVAAIAVGVVMLTGNSGKPVTGFVPTGSSPEQDGQQITTAFLQAWTAGNFSEAAHYTDQPAAAQAALASYQKDLHLRKFTGSTQSATALAANATSQTRVSTQYAITAKVASSDLADAISGDWKYHATLTAYQQKNSPAWYIAWTPSVLAPNLTATQHLAAVEVAPQVTAVSDASGNDLASYRDAGLTNIANLLEKQAPPGQGSPGLNVEIQTAAGKPVTNSQAAIIAPNNITQLSTTINSRAESAARSAVGMRNKSAMVVIQPSTGHILAIANNAGFNDFALTAAVAPGSTMKVITSTALISSGVLSAQSPVACPSAFTIQGITYHNDQGESEPAGTPFITDFAQSCNNAFTTQWSHLQGGGLAHAAKQYYGLNQRWNIGLSGVSASYFNAPASASGSELAQEAFGEGSLVASPIAMASVAATVDTGTFHQPILVPGTKQVTATPLPSSTDSQLHQMMQAVVTSGTAAGIGFGPGVYAKTGTADIHGQEQPNSWMIAFDPSKDVAVACLVVNAGYGAQFAGPEVKTFLDNF